MLQIMHELGLGEYIHQPGSIDHKPYQDMPPTPFPKDTEDEDESYDRGIAMHTDGKRYIFVPGEGFFVITPFAIEDTIPPRDDKKPMTIEEIEKFINELSTSAQISGQNQSVQYFLDEARLKLASEVGRKTKQSEI